MYVFIFIFCSNTIENTWHISWPVPNQVYRFIYEAYLRQNSLLPSTHRDTKLGWVFVCVCECACAHLWVLISIWIHALYLASKGDNLVELVISEIIIHSWQRWILIRNDQSQISRLLPGEFQKMADQSNDIINIYIDI